MCHVGEIVDPGIVFLVLPRPRYNITAIRPGVKKKKKNVYERLFYCAAASGTRCSHCVRRDLTNPLFRAQCVLYDPGETRMKYDRRFQHPIQYDNNNNILDFINYIVCRAATIRRGRVLTGV